MNMVSFSDALIKCDIEKNDILYIASDLSLVLSEAIRKREIETRLQRDVFLNNVINTIQNKVSVGGTLLIPAFSWAFCRGEGFDVNKTPSEVGALGNWVQKCRSDFKRTKHPMYSFFVWGAGASELCAMNNKDAWGSDSPFSWLHKNQGKMLLLNVSLQRGCTFMHYVEQMLKVPYRYKKEFVGEYCNEYGETENRKYYMFVRDLSIKSKEYLPDSFLEDKGIVKIGKWGNVQLKTVCLDKVYEVLSDDLLKNKGEHCYQFYNYEIDWNKGATHEDEIGNRLS